MSCGGRLPGSQVGDVQDVWADGGLDSFLTSWLWAQRPHVGPFWYYWASRLQILQPRSGSPTPQGKPVSCVTLHVCL